MQGLVHEECLVGELIWMKGQETGLLKVKTRLSEVVARSENRGKAASGLGPNGVGQNKLSLPFGYGEGSVPYVAPDFDAALEDFREYSSRIQIAAL